MRAANVCPCCGQSLMTRCGVFMTPRQREIFDLIERRAGGVTCETLGRVVYPGLAEKRASNRVKAHVNQINARLCATEWHIACPGRPAWGRYRLVREAEGTVQAA